MSVLPRSAQRRRLDPPSRQLPHSSVSTLIPDFDTFEGLQGTITDLSNFAMIAHNAATFNHDLSPCTTALGDLSWSRKRQLSTAQQ